MVDVLPRPVHGQLQVGVLFEKKTKHLKRKTLADQVPEVGDAFYGTFTVQVQLGFIFLTAAPPVVQPRSVAQL